MTTTGALLAFLRCTNSLILCAARERARTDTLYPSSSVLDSDQPLLPSDEVDDVGDEAVRVAQASTAAPLGSGQAASRTLHMYLSAPSSVWGRGLWSPAIAASALPAASSSERSAIADHSSTPERLDLQFFVVSNTHLHSPCMSDNTSEGLGSDPSRLR